MFEQLKRNSLRVWNLAQRFIPEPKPVDKNADALAVGLIGAGGIGGVHRAAIDRIAEVRLAGVSDFNTVVARQVGRRYDIPWHRDYKELLQDDALEAVIVASPSHLHAGMAMDVLDAGKHLLIEKPIALSVSEADRILARARERDLQVAVAHQFRTTSRFAAISELVAGGELGELLRGVWINHAVRTQAYYDASRWRGAWEGGGGALLNQYIHDIDMLCGVFGKPVEVSGKVGNLAHDTQVEDIATGVVVFESGAQVSFQVGLFDADPSSYLEVVGDKASLRESGSRVLSVPASPIRQYVQESAQQSGGNSIRERRKIKGKMEGGWGGHATLLRNFASAIRSGSELLVSGDDGRTALEVANGLLLSSATGRHIAIPIDRVAFDEAMTQMRNGEVAIADWFSSDAGQAAEKARKLAVNDQELAILGGPKAVSVEPKEQWAVPREEIKDAVGDLIDRNIFTQPGTGTTLQLEKRFADYIGSKFCLAQNNGTSTLWAAYYALGLGPGDEVIHPAYTWICAVAPAVHLGPAPSSAKSIPRPSASTPRTSRSASPRGRR